MTDPLPSNPSRSARSIAVITVLLAFLVGGLAGIAADRIWLHRHTPRFFSRPLTTRIVARLDRDLNLTADQRTQVTAILEKHQRRVAQINGAVRPQIRAEIEQGNAEIERVLTPEQRVKFEKLRMRMRGGRGERK